MDSGVNLFEFSHYVCNVDPYANMSILLVLTLLLFFNASRDSRVLDSGVNLSFRIMATVYIY